MKIISFILLQLLSADIFAATGVIIALEAPLFSEPNINSQIVQHMRKGEKLFVPDKELPLASAQLDYEQDDYYQSREMTRLLREQPHSTKERAPSEFYSTLDRNGNQSYILSKHIKFIYKDSREDDKKVYLGPPDPSDYRLEEPLPNAYPLISAEHSRFMMLGGTGSQRKFNYPYPHQIEQESLNSSKSMNFYYTRRIAFDPFNRLYFGGALMFKGGTYAAELDNGIETEESRGSLGIGPYISFDGFRNDKWTFSFFGSMTFDFNRIIIEQKTREGYAEQRDFKNFYFSGHAGGHLQYHFLDTFDFVGSLQADMYPQMRMKSNSERVFQGVWNEDSKDQLTTPFAPELSLFIGIQLRE